MTRLTSFLYAWTLIATTTGFCPINTNLVGRIGLQSTTSLGVAIDTSDIKNGMTLELDGEPYKVLSFSIMKQARGAAKTTIKFKNLMRGNTIENTYRSGEKFETALIEKSDHQFTYQEGVSLFSLRWKFLSRFCDSILHKFTTFLLTTMVCFFLNLLLNLHRIRSFS
jgi:hypothetical protein